MARMNKRALAHLNAPKVKADLFDGRKVRYMPLDMVYWANMVTREIYAHSFDAELSGVINGGLVAVVDDDDNIVYPPED